MADGICSVEGCETPILARGWCSKHYDRWRRNGDPEKLVRVLYPGDKYPARHCEVVGAWQKANPEKMNVILQRGREKQLVSFKTRRRKKYEQICSIKLDAGCMDCGYNLNAVALDFDHRPGQIKSFNISTYSSRSWEVILLEIAKCDVVCANCHRIRTVQRQQHLKRQENTESQYETVNSEITQT